LVTGECAFELAEAALGAGKSVFAAAGSRGPVSRLQPARASRQITTHATTRC
jgi:hypothetical protein